MISNSMLSKSSNTDIWCFITKFLSAHDSLPAAKRKYQEAVERVRESYNVLLASEQAYMEGSPEPLFTLLTDEIVGFGDKLTDVEKENYALFIFTTIVEVPEAEEDQEEDPIRDVAAKLELDAEDPFPSVFPSRTRSIWVSESGRESSHCISQ
ncbi:Uncharacterised protein [Corynebacterium kutscheri]|uniref:hypothetical protein n=1 Tax=Corynebacterium kutscheri TaxID=35755 RepID=UPI000F6FF492|nr:hypothetical protein [Corynebacterium kutscheri]VEH81371.1 Uncharacterised protein [Corynebacterium kutscheri]